MGNIGVTESKVSVVQKENEAFGDIVLLEGVEEVYSKLSRKVLRTFEWIDKHIDAVYYLKTDDDAYVVIDTLYQILTQENIPADNLLFGLVFHAAIPDIDGKWAERNWFLCERYLDYAAGAGYIVTRNIVKYLSHNADRLMHYKNEDVALGSWIAPLKVELMKDLRVVTWDRICKKTNWLLHHLTIRQIRQTHSAWINRGEVC